jgi:hypothetical protein
MAQSNRFEEITELRQRIATVEASILHCKSLIAALHESSFCSGREELSLRSLIDRREVIYSRLNGLIFGRDAAEPLMNLAA